MASTSLFVMVAVVDHGLDPLEDLRGRSFYVVQVSTQAGSVAVMRSPAARLVIRDRDIDGENAFWGACNHMTGTLTVDTERWHVVHGFSTLKGCPDPLDAQDKWMTSFLRSSPAWTAPSDTELVLESNGTRVTLVETDPAR